MKMTGYTSSSSVESGALRVLAAAAFLAAAAWPRPAAGALASGGEYELEASVRDSGGGEKLLGGEYLSRGSAGQLLSEEGPGLSLAGAYVSRAGFYNPPHFTFQKGLPAVVVFNSGSASLTLPPASIEKETFDITLNKDPMGEPVAVDPQVISEANGKMEMNEGSWGRLFNRNITEMSIFDEQDHWARPFAREGLLTMNYQDVNGDGVLDGSNPPVRVDTLRTWVLNESAAMWAKLPGSAVNLSARAVTAPFRAPGVYALLGMVDDSVKDTYAYPVPFRPNGPRAGSGSGQTGSEAAGITFTNVPQVGNIEIYTLDGRLVRKLAIPAGLVLPEVKWDVRTEGGQRAASGAYIWRVVSGSNYKTGKLMVIW